jgi:Kef-type K+ transport system membrane component KefB
LLSAASFLIPLVLASVLAIGLLPFSRPADVAVALAISVPSIPIVSVFLMRYDLLQTIPGEVALTSVAASEIVALIMLAVIADSATSAAQVVVYSVAAVVGFLLISRFLGRAPNVGKGFLSRASGKLATREAAFPVLIALGLLSAWIFQLVGIGYALGAFFAGVILRQYTFGSEVYSGADRVLSRLNSGFFIPVFFGFAGTLAVVPAGGYDTLASFVVIATVSVTSAVILSWFVSRKLAQGKAGLLALSLGGRGSVNIIIGSIALADGVIGRLEFTLIILSSLFVSIGVSLAMSRVRVNKKNSEQEEEKEC